MSGRFRTDDKEGDIRDLGQLLDEYPIVDAGSGIDSLGVLDHHHQNTRPHPALPQWRLDRAVATAERTASFECWLVRTSNDALTRRERAA